MKRHSTLFLKIVVCLLALGGLFIMLLEPQLEGRNANSDPITLYFNDPFLAYMYAASLPFFVALYQCFKLLGYIDRNKIFSQAAVNAVKTIKYCAIAFVAFLVASEVYLFAVVRGTDDTAGAAVLGAVIIFASVVVGTGAAVFQKLLQNAVDIKSEHDLTV